ncbi:hypothetical protein [Natronorarus salvus]|uniref:hypothetical protein n=1 Tax=Natronorarus salvus TaxID=3117733 RepID=UPI002F260BBC
MESWVAREVEELASRAEADRERFEPPEEPPDREEALAYLREGAGQAIWLYVEGRTGGRYTEFSPEAFRTLEGAMNDWFALYAACYGVELDPEVSIRTAAEALIDTENVHDTAQILTGVPESDNG